MLNQALEWLLEEEGGWSNHPADRGGKTMYGVTQGTYAAWRKKRGRPAASIRNISKEEAREIYESEYWNAAGCDRLPWPISYLTFDAAVNSGPSRAVRWTQAGLRVLADGKVGQGTITAANKAISQSDGETILRIVDQRMQFLVALVKKTPSQLVFLLGWMRRMQRVLGRALLANLKE